MRGFLAVAAVSWFAALPTLDVEQVKSDAAGALAYSALAAQPFLPKPAPPAKAIVPTATDAPPGIPQPTVLIVPPQPPVRPPKVEPKKQQTAAYYSQPVRRGRVCRFGRCR